MSEVEFLPLEFRIYNRNQKDDDNYSFIFMKDSLWLTISVHYGNIHVTLSSPFQTHAHKISTKSLQEKGISSRQSYFIKFICRKGVTLIL